MNTQVQSNEVEAIDTLDAEQIVDQFVSEGELVERLNFEASANQKSGGYC
jgi:hypothetical protein